MAKVSINGINFINLGGVVQINESEEVSLNNICLDDSDSKANSFLKLHNTQNLFINNVISTVSDGRYLIYFANERANELSSHIEMKDLKMNILNANPQTSASRAYFKFIVTDPSRDHNRRKWKEEQVLEARRITLQVVNPKQVIPVLAIIQGFDDVKLYELYIQKQSFFLTENGVFQVIDVYEMEVNNAVMENNQICHSNDANASGLSLFFYSKNVIMMNFVNNVFSFNEIVADSKLVSFRLIEVKNTELFILKNYAVVSNKFYVTTYILRFDAQPHDLEATNFVLSGITLEENFIVETQIFYFMMFGQSRIEVFDMQDFKMTNNKLTGRIFHFETLGNVDTSDPSTIKIISEPCFLNFTDIYIDNNQNLTNLVLLFFSSVNPSILPSDYVPASEYYSIVMKNLIVTNNKFYKGRSSDWIEQFSLIQITGSQIFIEDSKLKNNLFFHYDFVSLAQQISSVFFLNNIVHNNTFQNGNMIITRYEAITVTRGSFTNNVNKTVSVMYRYAFILDSNFAELNLFNSSLFVLNNAYLIFAGNNLDSLNLVNSLLITGGKFRPPSSDLIDFTFSRNLDFEQSSLSVKPSLLEIYAEAVHGLFPADSQIAYFYLIEKNFMANFYISGKTIITFQDYKFQQSIIEIKENEFLNFVIEGDLSHIIELTESPKAFRFHKNVIDHVKGVGSMLYLDLLEENELCILTNNVVKEFEGPSFLIAFGASITSMTISHNRLSNNRFSSSSIIIEITLNSGDIISSNNIFENNVLYSTDLNLYSKLSFVAIMTEAAKGHQMLLFEGWIFKENTYVNLKSFSQFGPISAFFSLLLANSTVIIKDCQFTGLTLESQGNSVFYIASQNIQITNTSFEQITVSEGVSVFNFMSLHIDLFANKFTEIDTLSGKGMIFLNTLPFLQKNIILNMKDNNFDACNGGNGNIMVVERTKLTIKAIHNSFTDCFDSRAAFFFESASCDNCMILNSTFIVRPQGADENHFYQLNKFSGHLIIENTFIQYFNNDDEPDLFLISTNSPNGNMTIINLSWSDRSNKNPLQIANVDSGNLTIQDTDLNKFFYSIKKAAGYIIQISAAPINLISAAVNLKNVRLTDMMFVRQFHAEKYKAGAIAFLGSGNYKSYYWQLNIEDCVFDSIINASVIYAQMPALYNIKIKNSIFQNGLNAYAPAINFYPIAVTPSQISLDNCIFYNNTGFKGAGAISLTASNYSIKNNQFIQNHAKNLGGAILIQNSIRADDFYQNNIFIDNTAMVGNDIASTLSKAQMTLILPPESGMKLKYITVPDGKGPTLTITEASSGWISKIGMKMTFLDRDAKPTLDFGSNNPNLVLTFGKQSTLTSFNCSWTECNIDRFNVTLSGLADEVIRVSVYYYSAPQTNGQGLLQTFNIKLRKCVPGEYNNTNTRTCDYCPEGSYSLIPSDSCQDCPTYASCAGGNNLISLAGFFRGSDESANLFQCREDGIQRCETGKCKEGYTGPLCEACDFKKGFIESGLLKCGKCEDVVMSLVLSFGIYFMYMLYKLFCISRLYSTNETFCSDRDLGYGTYRSSESGYYVKLLIVYTQVISLVYLFNMEAREFLGSLSQIGNPSAFIIVSMQCSFLAFGVTPDQLIYVSTIVLVASPIMQCILIYLVIQLVIKRFSRTIHPSQFFRLSVLYIIMVEQPGVVGYLASFLSCSNIYKDSKVEYIALHPNWTCEDPLYINYRNFLVIPSFIIWAICIPIYTFLVLFFKRKRLDSLNVRMTWGVLYNITKPQYYYWGTIVMILELIISYTAYAFQTDLKARVFTLFIMLWSYQFAVRQLKPYRYAKFNSMESLTFSLLMLNIILGYYAIDNNYPTLKVGAYAILAILNLSMTLFLAWKLFDITVMRIFDLSIEKFHYLMNRKGRLSPDTRERMLTIDSYTSEDNRSERAASIENEEYFERRTSYAHMKMDESFVL